MNIRIGLSGTALVAGMVFISSPASARPIRTDAGNINSCAGNTAQLPFSSGLSAVPDVCSLITGGGLDDQEPGQGPYEASAVTVYTWDDGITGNWDNSVQVVVYSLDGNFGDGSSNTPQVASGDTEFAFNYANGNGCLVNPSALSTPTLTFDGKTYQFTGANGAGICDAASTSDFVFSTASYVGWIDENEVLQTSGLPPGWTAEAASVPEPNSFSLTLIGGSLAAAFALSRRRRASR